MDLSAAVEKRPGHIPQFFRRAGQVAVSEANRQGGIDPFLSSPLQHISAAGLLAPHLMHADHLAVLHADNRLNPQQGAEHRAGGG